MTALPLQQAASPASDAQRFGRPAGGWRERLFRVIFESDTRAGRNFDLALIAVIVASVGIVTLDSVQTLNQRWGLWFDVLEWAFTITFTIEYLGRLACVQRPLRYATSFYGVIDLLALLPTWLAFFVPELVVLVDVRLLRLMRVFRIFKLSQYSAEYRALTRAVHASRRKISVFIGFVLIVVLVAGTLMYVVEGPDNGYTSIPVAVYWAITTMTTVGFGDITPKTDLGRLIASVMMLAGWGTLAVPTGIVTAEMAWQRRSAFVVSAWRAALHCVICGAGDHADDALYCRRCGAGLPSPPSPQQDGGAGEGNTTHHLTG